MNEQKILKNQLLKYIKSNIIMFITIFAVFGLLVYGIVSKVAYSSVGIELHESVLVLKQVLKKLDSEQFFNSGSNFLRDYNAITNSITSPKIICIIRDEDGEILLSNLRTNENNLYLEFDSKLIDSIYEVILDDEYYYRGITVDLSEVTSSQTGYIQLLSNVDIEKEMVNIYQRTILWSMLFGIIVSIVASVIMSKRNLAPVAKMLKRQNEFVQNVSHELRTPLTIVQAKQEMLLSEPNSKIVDKSEEIGVTLSEVKRMSKIIKDLTLLSRGDNKQIALQKEEVELDEFIENIAKNYKELVEIEEKSLVTNLNYKKVISIDTNKIYQVMIILLDNALKYTETGDIIEINTYAKEGKCIIEVKDTGIGISDEAIKHVFERFYREDTARSRETGGSGLGLSIADMIVSSHRGSIKASHNGNKGTIFTVKLPR